MGKRTDEDIEFELVHLKRFIADGGKCWACGDTGVGAPTLQEPGGDSCGCSLEDSAAYVLDHWDELVKREKEMWAMFNLPVDPNEVLDF